MKRAACAAWKKAGLSEPFLWCSLLLAPIWLIATASAESLVLEIVQAELAYDQRTREPIVVYRLTELSKRLFADFTTRNIGRKTELRVDGRIVMKPVIRQPILGGSGQLSGQFSLDEAKDIAARLSSGTGKFEVEVVSD